MKKILWVTNTVFPDLATSMGEDIPVVGGWMYGLAKDLVKKNISLSVVTARPNVKPQDIQANGVRYFLLNGQKNITEYDSYLEEQWRSIINTIAPDLVHIHGSEYAHGLALIKTHPNLKYVFSIQGLISTSSRYYCAQIPLLEIYKNITLRDIIKKNGILAGQKKFHYRGLNVEKKYFEIVPNIIGRTQWDFDHAKILNKNCNYFFCNESLRDSFYESEKWNIIDKESYTIFLSQAGYPIKGLHKVIEALNFIKDDFPNLKLRIAGGNIIKSSSIKDRLRLSGYGKYILKLINKFNLQDKIVFTGSLDQDQMVKEYLNCHIFICPSSIENSPNSLGEAQILGVPCIASYVGGVPDMVIHNETGLLYRFEEVEMLAQSIRRIFIDDSLAVQLSKNGSIAASKRHDREVNITQLIDIYQNLEKKNIETN